MSVFFDVFALRFVRLFSPIITLPVSCLPCPDHYNWLSKLHLSVISVMLNASIISSFLQLVFHVLSYNLPYPFTWAINTSNNTFIPLVCGPGNFTFSTLFLTLYFSLCIVITFSPFGAIFSHRQSCMSYLGETFHWPYSLAKYSLLQNLRTRLHIPCYSLVSSAPSNPL